MRRPWPTGGCRAKNNNKVKKEYAASVLKDEDTAVTFTIVMIFTKLYGK
jgi:hypothetical protein